MYIFNNMGIIIKYNKTLLDSNINLGTLSSLKNGSSVIATFRKRKDSWIIFRIKCTFLKARDLSGEDSSRGEENRWYVRFSMCGFASHADSAYRSSNNSKTRVMRLFAIRTCR